jgi:hypothetical protein
MSRVLLSWIHIHYLGREAVTSIRRDYVTCQWQAALGDHSASTITAREQNRPPFSSKRGLGPPSSLQSSIHGTLDLTRGRVKVQDGVVQIDTDNSYAGHRRCFLSTGTRSWLDCWVACLDGRCISYGLGPGDHQILAKLIISS